MRNADQTAAARRTRLTAPQPRESILEAAPRGMAAAGTRAALGSVAGDARRFVHSVESYTRARTGSARRMPR